MQMSDILCSPDDTCANVDLEQMPILGPNPEQISSVRVAHASGRPEFHTSHFYLFQAHIPRVQVQNRYIGPGQIVHLVVMTMSDYNV